MVTALIEHNRADLIAFVGRRVGSHVDPADIIQEVWAIALPAFTAGRVIYSRAFLFGIARNLAAQAMRHQYRRTLWGEAIDDADGVVDEAPSAYRVANAKNQLDALFEAVNSLSDRCREIFEMRHVQLLSKDEIAFRLGIGGKQVDKQLRHALAHCRDVLSSKNNLNDEGAKRAIPPT